MGSIIECRGVGFSYGEPPVGIPVFSGIDLVVEQGDFVALVGANGSGKSTLARMFNSLLLPTSGTVRINGMPTDELSSLWTIRQTVGMVFQNPDNQIVAARVADDIAFGPENLGVPSAEIRQRVRAAMAEVGLSGMEGRPPHSLSGGQKQRLAIAGVLAMKPSVLILDEATSMLDPDGRQEILSTVARLHREQRLTVILITHFMDEVALARRVIALGSEGIAWEGAPADLFMQTKLLRQLGLDVPPLAQVAVGLRQAGWSTGDALQVESLVEALCRSRLNA